MHNLHNLVKNQTIFIVRNSYIFEAQITKFSTSYTDSIDHKSHWIYYKTYNVLGIKVEGKISLEDYNIIPNEYNHNRVFLDRTTAHEYRNYRVYNPNREIIPSRYDGVSIQPKNEAIEEFINWTNKHGIPFNATSVFEEECPKLSKLLGL